MSVIEKHAPGSFCWVEPGTTSGSVAKQYASGAEQEPLLRGGIELPHRIDGIMIGYGDQL